MNFEYSDKTKELIDKLNAFMDEHIYPQEVAYAEYVDSNIWKVPPFTEALKEKAKKAGLWNLFLPKDYENFSPGLTNLEYAPLAEIMGRALWSSEIFNCSAPDTGNMEVLAKYGNTDQQEQWLKPLMNGEIRSAFLMTEPQVASSDATNIETLIQKNKDDYVINGTKWWSSGAMNPSTKFYIVMGKTDPTADRHHQQSMIIVPADTKGIEVIRPLKVFGSYDSPEGHAEIRLNNVRVPASNLIQNEGDGFRIAQGRLGPGRIHHCMRLIGGAQRALEMMCTRVTQRTTFGKELSSYSSIRQDIAKSKCEIEQARLLTLAAADKIDKGGIKAAKDLIAMIKIVVPTMTCKVTDRAMQAFGGMGFCQDTPLAGFWMYGRFLRMADGPDEVHMYQLGKNVVREYS
ncbi:acyl-CoA dehydrogenase family protein [Saprospiraceae bacterium]|nr:acyl-CoA dehydrogenase family protein [Saprospiraceae bacterium]